MLWKPFPDTSLSVFSLPFHLFIGIVIVAATFKVYGVRRMMMNDGMDGVFLWDGSAKKRRNAGSRGGLPLLNPLFLI